MGNISEHRKYVREQETKQDKQQTKFTIGIKQILIQKETTQTTKQLTNLNIKQNLICPFCLNVEILEHFIDKENKQYKKDLQITKHLAICPNCNQKIQWKTLFSILNMKTEQFAEWVFEYAFGGNFWSKISNFKHWNQRLYEMGMVYDFWKRYKELKGEKQLKFEQDQQSDEYFIGRYGTQIDME